VPAARFNQLIRDHWGVENRVHHVRDTRLQEDASRIRRNPSIFALLRSFALNLMRFNGIENISQALYDNA
jgi:predicted transposase YbfD/YdcC